MLYDALAPLYDRLMCHVEYDEWVGLIQRVVSTYGSTPSPSILEIGAGTGVLGERLRSQGYAYTGSDRSFSMSTVARSRGLSFFCADGRALPLHARFDLALFLYDGINYLPTLDDYTVLFREVHRVLNAEGLFLFDMTTETNSLRHFQNYLDFDDFEECAYVRRSYYRKQTMEQHNDFTIFRRSAATASFYEKIREHHTQIVFSASSVAKTVPRPLFSIEGIWDGYSFKNHRPHSERIHFLLKKRSR